jgi:hypothetical protein
MCGFLGQSDVMLLLLLLLLLLLSCEPSELAIGGTTP